jgi:hypothetical protein
MRDKQIRLALKKYLLTHTRKKTKPLILEELGVIHGTVRIDIAVVNNNSLHGYELKSDFDTLKRLPEQAQIYNSVFDYITLVVGYKHACNAMKIIPAWWGIKIVEKDQNGSIKLIDLRKAEKNQSTDALSIARLLWREEALKLLDEIASSKGFRSKTKNEIYNFLIKKARPAVIKKMVRKQLKLRKDWRVGL